MKLVHLIKPILTVSFVCLALTACTTAMAAEPAARGYSVRVAEKGDGDENTDPSKASAKDAFDAFRDALGGNGALKEPRTITVSASADCSAVPDMAEISFGVTTQAKTPGQAQEENNEVIAKVVDHLKERGVEERSITTSSYNLYPQYDYNGDTPKITGYQVSTTLTVRDQSIEEAGAVVDECVALGINDVNGIRFYAGSYEEVYEDALEKAMDAADIKAQVLAASAGGKLGQVLSVSEGYQDTSYRYSRSNFAMAEAADSVSAKGMSLMPGEAAITAQVTVTYELE